VRLKNPIWLLAASAHALVLAACGGSSNGGCPDGQIWVGNLYGPSSCRPPNACRSWSIFVAPAYPGPGEPHLAPDRAVTPARADLRVGARMNVGVDFVGQDPPGCADGVLSRGATWRTSDARILAVDKAGGYTATYIAVSPGIVRVYADGLNQPGGGSGPVELSICADPASTAKACARVPLEIRVVP
jgi:hypothetical protein